MSSNFKNNKDKKDNDQKIIKKIANFPAKPVNKFDIVYLVSSKS